MIQLRPANLSDYPAIARLHSDSWRENYRGIFSDAFLDSEVEKERSGIWYKRLKFPRENQRVILATSEDNLIGFSCLYLNDDTDFGSLLDNLHVAKPFQKSGIGKMLMKECAKIIGELAKSKKMYLWVYEANVKAINVYMHLGGVNIETAEKENEDGTKANACRFLWEDVSKHFNLNS